MDFDNHFHQDLLTGKLRCSTCGGNPHLGPCPAGQATDKEALLQAELSHLANQPDYTSRLKRKIIESQLKPHTPGAEPNYTTGAIGKPHLKQAENLLSTAQETLYGHQSSSDPDKPICPTCGNPSQHGFCVDCPRDLVAKMGLDSPTKSKPSTSPCPPLWRIPHCADIRESLIWAEGATKHLPDGNFTLFKSEDPLAVLERAAHAQRHLGRYIERLKHEYFKTQGMNYPAPEQTEDDIAKVRWFCSFVMWLEERQKAERK